MKRLVLMIVPALICGMLLSGCNSELATDDNTKDGGMMPDNDVTLPDNGELNSSGLYVIGTKSGENPTSTTDLVFTDDDIVSFGATMGEIVFSKEKSDEIISLARHFSELHFFIDGKSVFSSPIMIHFIQDSGVNLDLVFLISYDYSIRLMDSSLLFDCILWVDDKAVLDFQAKMRTRKQELDVLINYLSDVGKITGK